MKKLLRHLDTPSLATIVLTFILFLVAVFEKGLTQELLLESAVFLVSAKLIFMSYHLNVRVADLQQSLNEMKETLRRMESKNRHS